MAHPSPSTRTGGTGGDAGVAGAGPDQRQVSQMPDEPRGRHLGHGAHGAHGAHGGRRLHRLLMRYVLANPLRRLIHPPGRILAPFVRPGMTVLEPGPGVGFFTLELARRVGPTGRVVAVDVQPEMLAALRRRAERAKLLDRVDVRQAQRGGLGVADLAGTVDFVLAFAMVHEVSDVEHFFAEVAAAMKPGGMLLLAEPAGHVGAERFAAELRAAERAGLLAEREREVRIWRGRAVVLMRPA